MTGHRRDSARSLRDDRARTELSPAGATLSGRVANVLIQHNPDKSNWDIAVFDATNKGEDFKTKNVEDYLAKLN